MKIKNIVPPSIKRSIRIIRRKIQDYNSRVIFPRKTFDNNNFQFIHEETQEIKPSELFQNKLHNLTVGSERIGNIVIESGQIFSFWHLIGKPNKKTGFMKGRSIVDGKLIADYGGGLCQLSSLIYIASLKSGLQIEERHNHSIDIYNEDNRFMPLGADATVAYGYKDLRVKNTYPFPIKFSFDIRENKITCYLHSKQQIDISEIEFVRSYNKNTIIVKTLRNNSLVATSKYVK